MRKHLISLLLLTACAACTTPATRDELPDPAPGYKPETKTDEAGLWMQMNQAEEEMASSGLVVRDPALNAYVKGVVCRVTGPRCRDIRVYILRVPHFNASMAPNGTMQVWTGLLLRATNEAQLAYVVAHETGHYLRRHSLQMWRDMREKSSMFAFLNVLGATAGAPGYAYDIAQLSVIGTLLKFSRDAEREADDLGFGLTAEVGYDPREAPLLWKALLKESKADDDEEPWIFFSTHPHTKERIGTLDALAQKAQVASGADVLGKARYAAAIAPWRGALLQDELQQRRFDRTEVLLNRLIADGNGLGELYYYQGEMFRLRGDDGDTDKAKQAYQQALGYDDAPAETHRDLGILYMRSGEKRQARDSFARYLQLKPDAEDRAMVQSYVEQLG